MEHLVKYEWNNEWNSLDYRIRDLPSISSFKRAIFEFIRPKPSLTFNVQNNYGLVLITRLRVGFSHLREHKFRHGFFDTLDPFCSCRANAVETTEHYLLQCSNFSNERLELFNSLKTANVVYMPLSLKSLGRLLLFGDSKLSDNDNHVILSKTINFICKTNRFSGSIFE